MKTEEQAIGFTPGMLFTNGYVAGNTLHVAGQQGPDSDSRVTRWGKIPLPEIKARAVELWLSGLNLAPKSRSNIRMMLSVIFEYAMWAELIPVDRNPMELVRVKNVSKPGRKARTMRLDEFHRLCEKAH